MAPRLPVALAGGALAVAVLAGCSEGGREPAAVTPATYIVAVQELMDPPAQLAAEISERVEDPATAGAASRCARLVVAARERLAGFRALPLPDPVLRGQRDRLAGAYARMVPRMQRAAESIATPDRATLRRAVDPFLDSLRALPSAAATSSSSR